jgi:hypothetical protein
LAWGTSKQSGGGGGWAFRKESPQTLIYRQLSCSLRFRIDVETRQNLPRRPCGRCAPVCAVTVRAICGLLRKGCGVRFRVHVRDFLRSLRRLPALLICVASGAPVLQVHWAAQDGGGRAYGPAIPSGRLQSSACGPRCASRKGSGFTADLIRSCTFPGQLGPRRSSNPAEPRSLGKF